MTETERVEKFITDNELDFSGEGSELNGNAIILAGFICYIVQEKGSQLGHKILDNLKLSDEAREELNKTYNYAWYASYDLFWEKEEAHDQYFF